MASSTSSPFISTTINIGLVVSNLEKSIAFYTDVIGMQKAGGFSITKEIAIQTGLTPGIPFDVTIMKLGTDDNATQYKIMSFGKKKGWLWHWCHQYINRKLGVNYITILVDDLDPVLERIKAQGIPALGETPFVLKTAEGNQNYLLIQDPDGVFVEVIAPIDKQV